MPRWRASRKPCRRGRAGAGSAPARRRIFCSTAPPTSPALRAAAAEIGADAARAGRRRRATRSCWSPTWIRRLIGQECIDELAKVAGIGERVAEITERAMRGELDFPGALRERVGLLEGLDIARHRPAARRAHHPQPRRQGAGGDVSRPRRLFRHRLRRLRPVHRRGGGLARRRRAPRQPARGGRRPADRPRRGADPGRRRQARRLARVAGAARACRRPP